MFAYLQDLPYLLANVCSPPTASVALRLSGEKAEGKHHRATRTFFDEYKGAVEIVVAGGDASSPLKMLQAKHRLFHQRGPN